MDAKTRKRLRRLLEAEEQLKNIPPASVTGFVLVVLVILLVRGCQ